MNRWRSEEEIWKELAKIVLLRSLLLPRCTVSFWGSVAWLARNQLTWVVFFTRWNTTWRCHPFRRSICHRLVTQATRSGRSLGARSPSGSRAPTWGRGEGEGGGGSAQMVTDLKSGIPLWRYERRVREHNQRFVKIEEVLQNRKPWMPIRELKFDNNKQSQNSMSKDVFDTCWGLYDRRT